MRLVVRSGAGVRHWRLRSPPAPAARSPASQCRQRLQLVRLHRPAGASQDFEKRVRHQGQLRRLRQERGARDQAPHGQYRLRRRGAVGAVPRAPDPGGRRSRSSTSRELPNLKYLDPDVAAQRRAVRSRQPVRAPITCGSPPGLGYNAAGGAAHACPMRRSTAGGMLYDPAVVSKLKDCGVTMLDEPTEVIGTALLYLGRNPNSESPADLAAAMKVLTAIRPYVRYVNSSRYIDDLANGEICLALGWSGDVKQAHAAGAARPAGPTPSRYPIPREGAIENFDVLAIPADAPHPRNAQSLHQLSAGSARRRAQLQPASSMPTAMLASRPYLDAIRARRPGHLSAAGGAAHPGPGAGEVDAVHATAHPRLDELQDRRAEGHASQPNERAAVDVAGSGGALRPHRGREQEVRRLPRRRRRLARDPSAARSSACWAAPAPARRRCCGCWRASRRRAPDGSTSTART